MRGLEGIGNYSERRREKNKKTKRDTGERKQQNEKWRHKDTE